MKYKLILIIILLKFSAASSQTQILERYPDHQLPYKGGYEAYYKDFHDIIIDKKLQPCSNKNEIYQFSVLVRPDSTIQFIKDLNAKVVESNKCTHDLAREVAKYQKGWSPALINNIKQSAVARFMIFPDDLFNNYREGSNFHIAHL